MPIIIQEDEVLDALRKKFGYPSHAFFEHIRDCTGFSATRTADALAMSLWPGRGLTLEGFEIKVDRGDWLKELKTPEKSEVFVTVCDHWWVVAPKGIINKDEVPKTWGWLELRGKRLFYAKPAPKLKPKPLSRELLASLLYRSISDSAKLTMKEAQEHRNKGFEEGEKLAKQSMSYASKTHQQLKESVEAFEKHSGIRLSGWQHGEEVGKAVRLVLDHGAKHILQEFTYLIERLRGRANDIENDIKGLPQHELDDSDL